MSDIPIQRERVDSDHSSDSIGRRLQADFKGFLAAAADSYRGYGFLGDAESELRELSDMIVRPFNIAVFGRMKTGKSSIVNALVGRRLAITGVEETTATVNVISHVGQDSRLKDYFTVHWRDAPPETLPLEVLRRDWSGKSDVVLSNVARTRYLQLYSDAENLALHEIIDTPGTGSIVTQHEKVAQDFLDPSVREGRKADALVYVFEPTGRESDEADLKKFREGCLAGTRPYNSVGVLHKWDGLYWNNGGDMAEVDEKCARLKTQLGGLVADMIPVSAPMELFARTASDECLERILSFVRGTCQDGLTGLLRVDIKWNRDETRRALRAECDDLPWVCFCVALRECSTKGRNWSANELRDRLRELGGFDAFREMLDRRFFKQGALIRQRQIYSRVDKIRTEASRRIKAHLESCRFDSACFGELADFPGLPDRLLEWLNRKRTELERSSKTLAEKWTKLDGMFLNSEMPKMLDDISALEWCETCPFEEIRSNAEPVVKPILDALSGIPSETPGRERIAAFLGLLSAVAFDPSSRIPAAHLSRRIAQFAASRNMES